KSFSDSNGVTPGKEIDPLKFLSYSQDDDPTGDVEVIPLAERRELGLMNIPTGINGPVKNGLLRGPIKYYNQQGIKNLVLENPFEWDQARLRRAINKRILESKVKNPDRLVPFEEVYVLPEIFDQNSKKSLEAEDELTPRGFDRFGLLEIPSKERAIRNSEFGVSNSGGYRSQRETRLSPLNIDDPENREVYYINVGGIRKLIPNYSLNPKYKRDISKEKIKFYENDKVEKEVLKEFLKIIQEKKRKKRVNRHLKNSMKNESTRQRVAGAYKIHLNAREGSRAKIRAEFAPLSALGGGSSRRDTGGANERISFSDISGENNREASVPKEIPYNRIYTPGKNEAEDMEEDEQETPRNRQVRFNLSQREEKPKKKYVSPPPQPYSDSEDDEE
ncbi:putative integral membrane protein, partial [Cryptosporidium felis]